MVTVRISHHLRMVQVGFEWMLGLSNNYPPTVLFIGASYETIAVLATILATLTSAFPYGMRARLATVHVEPSTHIAGLIRVKVVTRPPTVLFRRPGQIPPPVTF